jgi:hypothetical protein
MSEQSNLNDEQVEAMIKKLGLRAPRLTPQYINDQIKEVRYERVADTTSVVCYLILNSGFVVHGDSGCISSENFNEELGRTIAFEKAKGNIWGFEGYFVKKLMHMLEVMENSEVESPSSEGKEDGSS